MNASTEGMVTVVTIKLTVSCDEGHGFLFSFFFFKCRRTQNAHTLTSGTKMHCD